MNEKLFILIVAVILLFGGIQMTEASGGPDHRKRSQRCVPYSLVVQIDDAAQHHWYGWKGWQKLTRKARNRAMRLNQKHIAHLLDDSLLYRGRKGASLAFTARDLAHKKRCK